MAVYRYTLNPVPNTSPQQYTASLQLTDRPIYGSKRLGSHTRPMEMVGTTPPQYYPYTQPMPAYRKQYELTDHLGNVATVITGRLLPDNSGTSAYRGEVLSAQGYEPFGMELPGRHWQSDVSRFGFQGQLKDREIAAIPFKYRMYSPDGSGFWSIDPLATKYPFYSPYAFSGNRVIDMIELEGLEPAEPGSSEGDIQQANVKDHDDWGERNWLWTEGEWTGTPGDKAVEITRSFDTPATDIPFEFAQSTTYNNVVASASAELTIIERAATSAANAKPRLATNPNGGSGVGNPAAYKGLARNMNIAAGVVGALDNTMQAANYHAQGNMGMSTFEASQAGLYVAGTALLFTPAAPLGAAIILINGGIDIFEALHTGQLE